MTVIWQLNNQLLFLCPFSMGGIPARNSKGERLLIYIGIIDILQSYRFKERINKLLLEN